MKLINVKFRENQLCSFQVSSRVSFLNNAYEKNNDILRILTTEVQKSYFTLN